jgi:hypothetical protein
MVIDLGLNDVAAMKMLTWAIRIIDESVGRLRDEIGSNPPSDDTEVYRLAQALPAGPITFDHTVFAAATAARDALDQVSYILRNEIPTSAIVLQALIRSALVGSGRTTFALLPADPNARLQNANVVVAQESNSYMRALDEYAKFEKLLLMRPKEQDRATAQTQNDALHNGGRLRGDGAVMTGAAEVVGAALAAAPDYPEGNRQLQREHVIWLWNTYSGLAHTYSWPRLMPSSGRDGRVPGDFPGDLFMVANTAHIAMLSLQSRLQPGSANTTAPVPMRPEPSKPR